MKISLFKIQEPAFIGRWRQKLLGKGDPTKTMSRAYILALGVIAFLTLSNHLIIAHISNQQKDSFEMAYMIGRQRALVQQIVDYAENYYELGERLDYDFMMQSLWDLETGHNFLAKKISERNLLMQHMSEALYKIYFKTPYTLDEHIKVLHTIVDTYSKFGPKDDSVKRQAVLRLMSEKSHNIIRPAMEAALESYQNEILQHTARFYTIQFGSAVFILMVLIAEAAFIFRPLVTQIKLQHQSLQKMALEDPLTGLNNRRAFMKGSENELKRAKRDQKPVTVALLDLDHFKSVNDTYGHEVGDRVLKHFSAILKKSFRASDIPGRIGGEEFAILLPHLDHDGAKAILQRLCDTVASTPCPYIDANGEKAELAYTVSIGYTGPALVDEQSIDDLLAKADEGLYGAKEQGRNCVVSGDSLASSAA